MICAIDHRHKPRPRAYPPVPIRGTRIEIATVESLPAAALRWLAGCDLHVPELRQAAAAILLRREESAAC